MRLRDQPLRKKLLTFVLADPAAYWLGGEAIVIDGADRGRAQLGGLKLKAGACTGLGYVRGDAAQQEHAGTPVQIDLWGEPASATAWDVWPAKAPGGH